ncbi:hypothetical protein [Opitutus terrae]|uniref:AsmA-like C-terminal domain-containing protein n=1 Tax=Opitutus terrae (strain DSM 11246 / JCM 15787 / PB90-1) TaxID=452637 RepID=B1ZYH7_OPITP|nr:hypothetical protein [Opitutus terrae]ACB77075.1 hypothetical protein Oter_3800 [Opitutus terrae PB90-1]
MKAVRGILIGLGVVILLLLVLVAVAFNSSVQTWAARKALASRPDLHGGIGSVSAGWSQVQLRDVRLERHGAVLTLPALDADVPLVRAGIGQNVNVRRLVAKGWTLDLTKAAQLSGPARQAAAWLRSEPAGATAARGDFSLLPSAYAAESAQAAAPMFRGVFHELQLPVDLSLDGVELDGEVILPPLEGQGPLRLRVVVHGGGLAANREGNFTVDVSAAKGDGGALTLHAQLAATMDTPRTFARLGTRATAMMSGTQHPAGVKLDANLEATRTPTGETYALLLVQGEKQLASLQGTLTTATARIGGTWKVDLGDADLAPFLLGQPLPTFTAVGEGGFATDTTFGEVHASGRLQASADRLAVARPELAGIGRTNVTADFDVLQHGRSLRVERLTANLSGQAPVASVRALQPFEFNLSTAELRVADPAQDLVGVVLTGLPVAWAQPFAGELRLGGGDVSGEFAASARDGGLALRSRRPLTIHGFSLSDADGPLLQNLDVTLNASADYTPLGWQAQVVELTLRQAGATLLALDAKAGRLTGPAQPIKVTGRWSADLPGWTNQPAVHGALQLVSGTAQGEFNASIDGTRSIETRLSVMNLVATTKETLPAITAEVRADMSSDGHVTFKSPWLFEHAGRKSDLLLSGTFTPGKPAATVDARLTGELIHLEDVRMLALLVPGETAEDKSAKPEEKPAGAPWAGIGGQITLALKKVVQAEDFEVTDVAGALRIDPQKLSLDAVRAVFGPESDLKLNGGVRYDPQAAQAYAFNGDLVVRNLETGPVFRAMDPAKLPTIEGKVNVTSHLAGAGASLGEVVERTQGQFEITSKGGVFRALATVLPAERMQTAQSALSIVGGLFGGSTEETVNTTLEIVKILAEIPFDQLSVKAERGTNLDLLLQDFTLISPTVRLAGAGKLDYVPGRPLLQQALDLQINLGARGRLGELLGKVKLLKAETDNLGYSAFSTPIKIGGTLAHTDTSDLQTKLLNLAVEKSGVGEAINKILGGRK